MGWKWSAAVLVLLTLLFSAKAQQGFRARVIAGGNNMCPSENELNIARANISQQISSIIPTLRRHSRLGRDQENPATSCQQIIEDSSSASSGDYWLRSGNGSAVQMFCNMTRRCCNSAGGWTRVAYLDMTDPTHQCPRQWKEILTPKRTCGRTNETLSDGGGCSTARFNGNGITYSRVCGRITAYQFAQPNAFGPYRNTRDISGTIYDPYVDGVVVTQDAPRSHVWTFAGAHSQTSTGFQVCPCTNANNPSRRNILIPPWVGEDYFCETGVNDDNDAPVGTFFPDDPLWDGRNCTLTSTCCELNNPPWFCKRLDMNSVSDIEVSICGNDNVSNEDTPIEMIEIYVK